MYKINLYLLSHCKLESNTEKSEWQPNHSPQEGNNIQPSFPSTKYSKNFSSKAQPLYHLRKKKKNKTKQPKNVPVCISIFKLSL